MQIELFYVETKKCAADLPRKNCFTVHEKGAVILVKNGKPSSMQVRTQYRLIRCQNTCYRFMNPLLQAGPPCQREYPRVETGFMDQRREQAIPTLHDY